MKSYRGFLFDADNTLFDYDRAEKEALAEAIAAAAPGIPDGAAVSAYRAVNADYWKRFEEGSVTLDELKIGRFRDFLGSLGARGDPEALSAAYCAALSRKAYFLPHAREVLEELARTALLCIVTNGLAEVQRGRIERSGIGGLLAAVIVSEEIGISKPDPRFFRAAAEALGLGPGELLCVGDSPSTDIAGAAAAGIDACWYSPAGAPWAGPGPAPAFVAADLRDLLAFAPGSSQR